MLKVHRDRMNRRREVQRAQKLHDVVLDRDLERADEFKRTDRDYRSAILRERRARAKRESSGVDIDVGDILSAPVRAVGGQLKREVEGRGILAGIGREVGGRIGTNRTAGERIAGVDNEPAEILKRAGKDIANVPAAAVPSAYQIGRAGVHLAKGDDKPAKQLLKDIKENDPLYAAVTGDLKRAAKLASEHPGFTALEVAGAKGLVGRGAGRTARTGGKVARKTGEKTGVRPVERAGEAVERVASTRREPRKLPGTALEQQRAYSPDVITKGRQVATEKVRRRRAETLRRKADEREQRGETGRAQELRQKAVTWDPDLVKPREVRRRVNEQVAAREDIRRGHRAETQKTVRGIVKKVPKSQRALVPLVAQRIANANPEDLRAYSRELAAEHPRLDKRGRKANERMRKQIDDALKGNVDAAKIEQAASKYHAEVIRTQEKLIEHGLLERGQTEMVARIPYAVRRMGAEWHKEKGIVDKKGEPITVEAINRHMEETDTPAPSYVSQASRRPGAFNVRHERAQAITGPRRTGEATRKGTFDTDAGVLEETAARSQGLVDAVEGFHGLVKEVGARGDTGRPKVFRSRKAADKAAENLAVETGQSWRPIRVLPPRARRDQLQKLLDDTEAEALLEGKAGEASPVVRAISDALEGHGSGNWALIPEAAANQLQKHLNTMSAGGIVSSAQKIRGVFSRTVLTTSTKWPTANATEAALRTALTRAGPRSYYTGKQVLKKLEEFDPDAAREAIARTVGGGHLSMAAKTEVRRTAAAFEGTWMGPVAKALARVWETPGPKQAASLWRTYTQTVYRLNAKMENQFQTAMLGKALRDSPLMDDRLVKITNKAITEAAEGLRNTNAQVAAGRAVDRAYGKYSKFSPELRQLISTVTPFSAWWLNTARFLFDVLPRDHPVATGLLAAAENLTEEWREEHGLDRFAKHAVPEFLQGSIPVEGGHIRASEFTPFSGWIDPLENSTRLVLPQFSGAMLAGLGVDWKGTQTRANFGGRVAMFGHALAGAFVPGFGMLERSTGTIGPLPEKARTQGHGVEALNPFRPTRPGKKKAKKKSGWQTGGWGTGKDGWGTSKDGGFGSGGFSTGSPYAP